MDSIGFTSKAVESVRQGQCAFCKFLSANDTGKTGGHQAGIYIPKNAVSLIFPTPFEKGANHDRWAEIRWMADTITKSRFIYYGRGTRNEYRITHCISDHFDPLDEEHTGALLVLVRREWEAYDGWVLNHEDEINDFLAMLDLDPAQVGGVIETSPQDEQGLQTQIFQTFASTLSNKFPTVDIMSAKAREIQDALFNHKEYTKTRPDRRLLDWLVMEYRLFRYIEDMQFHEKIRQGFSSMEEFLSVANSITNRRKSRAGKSLENHLAAIFTGNCLTFDAQVITEGRKRPDFIFPGGAAYHDPSFNAQNLIVLAAKTTCKDRWRQILNEANRVRDKKKYLCTLQQGVSSKQMQEMLDENVTLVVPAPYIARYPKAYQKDIMSLQSFIDFAKAQEGQRFT